MRQMRAILFSIVAVAFWLTAPAIGQNTEVVPATTAPARGAYAILVGDLNGQQLNIAFSATVGGEGRIVLPVFLDGQSSNINVTLGSGAVVSIDHTVTVTGTLALSAGAVVSIDHTVTVTGSVGLNAGTNNIGDVDVLTLPAIPAGSNSIGTVGLDAGTNNIGDVDVLTLPSIPTGTNEIGSIQLLVPGSTTVAINGFAGMTPVQVEGDLNISARDAPNSLVVSTASASTFAVSINAGQTVGLDTGSNAIGTVGVTFITPGTGTTNLGKTVAQTYNISGVGVMSLGVRRDSPIISPGIIDGEYSTYSVNQEGVLYMVPTYDIIGDGTVSVEQSATVFSSGPVGESGVAAHVSVVAQPSMVVFTQRFPLTISTGAYTAKDALGGLMIIDFANIPSAPRSGIIQSVIIRDDDGEEAPITISFFDASYIAATDNLAMDPTDAEQDENIGAVEIVKGNYVTYTDNAVATRAGLGLAFNLSSTGFYAQCMIEQAKTYTATTDVEIEVAIIVQ